MKLLQRTFLLPLLLIIANLDASAGTLRIEKSLKDFESTYRRCISDQEITGLPPELHRRYMEEFPFHPESIDDTQFRIRRYKDDIIIRFNSREELARFYADFKGCKVQLEEEKNGDGIVYMCDSTRYARHKGKGHKLKTRLGYADFDSTFRGRERVLYPFTSTLEEMVSLIKIRKKSSENPDKFQEWFTILELNLNDENNIIGRRFTIDGELIKPIPKISNGE